MWLHGDISFERPLREPPVSVLGVRRDWRAASWAHGAVRVALIHGVRMHLLAVWAEAERSDAEAALPNSFSAASIDQYIGGEDLTSQPSLSNMNLRDIQSEIWRRILVNMNDIIRSKGTIHGIKSVMRATGINPDNILANLITVVKPAKSVVDILGLAVLISILNL